MPAQPTPPRISGYDFIQPLGTGATASVYRYHQRVPSRDVAIKVSSATLDPRAAARFRNEANYMAELSAHPYILSIHDAGVTSTGLGYIVLEYAPGGSYKELIQTTSDTAGLKKAKKMEHVSALRNVLQIVLHVCTLSDWSTCGPNAQ